MNAKDHAERVAARHHVGAMSVPMMSFLLSLVIGAGVGLAVAFLTNMPWLGIVAGVGAMLLTWVVAGSIYYRSDFTRYRKIRSM